MFFSKNLIIVIKYREYINSGKEDWDSFRDCLKVALKGEAKKVSEIAGKITIIIDCLTECFENWEQWHGETGQCKVYCITWVAGEVGPGEGGYAEFSVNVRGDAELGTEIINFGIVYFPTVSEVTRTNGIVSRVPVVESYEMNLPEGWSMISLPVLPDNALIPELFPGTVVVYGYKKGSGYVRMTDEEQLKAGTGYWILLNEGKRYTLTGQTIQKYTLSVNEERWYMIGGCTYQAKASEDNGNIGVIYSYVQGIGYQRIPESENLKPGKGYWILISDISGHAQLSVETENP